MVNAKEAALRELARSAGLDAVIAMSPENFNYAAGVHLITVGLIRDRQAFFIMPAKGGPEVIVCTIEQPLTRAESWVPTVHGYTEFVDDPMRVLADRLEALGLGAGRVGIDKTYLPIASYERLAARLPKLVLVDTTAAVAALRAVKTPEEIAAIERGTRGTHRAALDAMAASRPGETERDMCLRIANGILRNGADTTLFLCFGSGPRALTSHAMATDRVPHESELIRFDIGGTYGPFSSDFARTYSTGNPTALQRQTHAALVRTQKATLAAIRPGVTAEDLFHACREAFAREGLRFSMPHVGHSFGVELHEAPLLRPGEKSRITPGMVLNIEPITLDGAGGKYHTEDLVEVTESGFRLMTLGLAPEEIPVIGRPVATDG